MVLSPRESVPNLIGTNKLSFAKLLFKYYLDLAKYSQQTGLYNDFLVDCCMDASDQATKAVIEELDARNILPNAAVYLAWFNGNRL